MVFLMKRQKLKYQKIFPKNYFEWQESNKETKDKRQNTSLHKKLLLTAVLRNCGFRIHLILFSTFDFQ